jgi:hypothetical protein
MNSSPAVMRLHARVSADLCATIAEATVAAWDSRELSTALEGPEAYKPWAKGIEQDLKQEG